MKPHNSGSPSRGSCKKQKTVHMNNVVEFRFFMALPISVRADILNYVGDTNKQEELRELLVISKGMNEVCRQPGIEWELIPLFLLSPRYDKRDGGSTRNFIYNMSQHYQQDVELQRYRRFRVNDVHLFNEFDIINDDETQRLIDNIHMPIRMNEIESLDISLLSLPSLSFQSFSLPYALSWILPNLIKLDLSNTGINTHTLESFSEHCPHLENIKYNNITTNAFVRLSGKSMQTSNEMKVITMDNSYFDCTSMNGWKMFDLNNSPEMFLFYECGSKVLERVSIRNAKWQNGPCIDQSGLIKFIRNAPSTLICFRSNLTPENITMLQKERPDIEFQN